MENVTWLAFKNIFFYKNKNVKKKKKRIVQKWDIEKLVEWAEEGGRPCQAVGFRYTESLKPQPPLLTPFAFFWQDTWN